MSPLGYEAKFRAFQLTSAIPPTTDILAARLAFALFSSAYPPGADLPDGVAEGPILTPSRHSGARQTDTWSDSV